MSSAGREEPPLSIGYVSPGWPPSAFFNGVLTAIGTLAPPLRAMGHRVTILAGSVADGSAADESVYDLSRAGASGDVARRTLERIGYRVAPQWTHERVMGRAIVETARSACAERGIQVLEMEEAFGLGGGPASGPRCW